MNFHVVSRGVAIDFGFPAGVVMSLKTFLARFARFFVN